MLSRKIPGLVILHLIPLVYHALLVGDHALLTRLPFFLIVVSFQNLIYLPYYFQLQVWNAVPIFDACIHQSVNHMIILCIYVMEDGFWRLWQTRSSMSITANHNQVLTCGFQFPVFFTSSSKSIFVWTKVVFFSSRSLSCLLTSPTSSSFFL